MAGQIANRYNSKIKKYSKVILRLLEDDFGDNRPQSLILRLFGHFGVFDYINNPAHAIFPSTTSHWVTLSPTNFSRAPSSRVCAFIAPVRISQCSLLARVWILASAWVQVATHPVPVWLPTTTLQDVQLHSVLLLTSNYT